jgi:hypothetical protein
MRSWISAMSSFDPVVIMQVEMIALPSGAFQRASRPAKAKKPSGSLGLMHQGCLWASPSVTTG